MKKMNLLKRSRFWMASLGLFATSTLVLAACANNAENKKEEPNQSENQKSDDKSQSADAAKKEENKDSKQSADKMQSDNYSKDAANSDSAPANKDADKIKASETDTPTTGQSNSDINAASSQKSQQK
ncbi:cytoskeletal protein RodZ [Mycoplasmoides fastidiosum]|uniref:Cytoskeletal protein RodZ n=1 Tax=Mycoplasmoides fastidiosum TaxID=92758 RepID=A0ABU0LYX8_9BACT|nr:hypothetical protein [Mycoplasmoides fastidiosum]MDQ0513905.1 cytoskeletal protein RodZ [Mycoplasmoides fastidiosum]UUD37681.1 hypothetical protein NPA10_03880 [Mycoplasmoides fastidiosum]